MNSYGIRIPLSESGTDGFQMIYSRIEMVKQNFKMLLMTAKGERSMLPDYGAGLGTLLFEMNNDSFKSNVDERIYEQVKRYMPYLNIKSTEIFNKDSFGVIDNKVGFRIIYEIIPLGVVDKLEL